MAFAKSKIEQVKKKFLLFKIILRNINLFPLNFTSFKFLINLDFEGEIFY